MSTPLSARMCRHGSGIPQDCWSERPHLPAEARVIPRGVGGASRHALDLHQCRQPAVIMLTGMGREEIAVEQCEVALIVRRRPWALINFSMRWDNCRCAGRHAPKGIGRLESDDWRKQRLQHPSPVSNSLHYPNGTLWAFPHYSDFGTSSQTTS